MNNLKRIAALLAALMLCTCSAFATEAGPKGGEGAETGSDQETGVVKEEMVLVGSIPENNAVGVSVDTEIHCIFPYSVTRDPRLRNNLNLMMLEDIDGHYIPTEAYVPGDRPSEEEGRVLSLEPLEPLAPATTYVVRIGPGIKSRNGLRTEREQFFTFTTADENGEAVPAREPKEENIYESYSGSKVSEEEEKIEHRYQMTVSVMIICVAAAFPLYLLIKGRKKKDE